MQVWEPLLSKSLGGRTVRVLSWRLRDSLTCTMRPSQRMIERGKFLRCRQNKKLTRNKRSSNFKKNKKRWKLKCNKFLKSARAPPSILQVPSGRPWASMKRAAELASKGPYKTEIAKINSSSASNTSCPVHWISGSKHTTSPSFARSIKASTSTATWKRSLKRLVVARNF